MRRTTHRWMGVNGGRRDSFLPALHGPRTGLVYLPQLDEEDAEEGLAPIEERVSRRGARIGESSSVEDMHRLRRGLRRLRYAREWLGKDVDDVREILEALGKLDAVAT